MKRYIPMMLSALVLLYACAASKKTESLSIANNGKAWSSLWQQRAAEYKALCFQAYNVARMHLDANTREAGNKPYAIITDIDETVLDNSPYDALRAVNNADYTGSTWKNWTAKAQADTVPGAPSFLKYAATKGVTVFYITNRDQDEQVATLKNLQQYGLPNADETHLLLRQNASSKESRRQSILSSYNVILLCGDNLPDFDALYDNKPTERSRQAATEKLRKEFGSRYIVIPNPSYGDWEGALFDFNYKLMPTQKDSIIRAKLKIDHQ